MGEEVYRIHGSGCGEGKGKMMVIDGNADGWADETECQSGRCRGIDCSGTR